MDAYKEFNKVKREDYPFATEVFVKVAEGAFMDFGKALANRRNRDLKSKSQTFKKKKATGTRAFRAASGMDHIAYDGKRRVQIQVLFGQTGLDPPEGHPP